MYISVLANPLIKWIKKKYMSNKHEYETQMLGKKEKATLEPKTKDTNPDSPMGWIHYG